MGSDFGDGGGWWPIDVDINQDQVPQDFPDTGFIYGVDQDICYGTQAIDLNGDGNTDLYVSDTTGNGKTDLWVHINANGDPYIWERDTNGDGKADFFYYDTNGDRKPDKKHSERKSG